MGSVIRTRLRATALVLTVFCIIFFVLGAASFRLKSATWDEPIHLAAGYAAAALGDHRVDPTHPPLLRIWAALPLLVMDGVTIDTSEIDRTPKTEWLPAAYTFAHRFLYENNDADRLLYAARFMALSWGIVLGILLFCWARDWLGFGPAVLALAMYTLEPNLGAHARLVTTDFAPACFFFGTVYWLWRVWRRTSALNIAGLTVCFALALVAKFSGVLLVPIVLVLLSLLVLRQRISLKAAAGIAVLLVAAGFVTIWAAYGFRYAPSASETWLFQTHDFPSIRERAPRLAVIAGWVDERRILPNAFTQGFLLIQSTSRLSSYLAGEVSPDGWWYYFLFAFLVKTPSPMIALFLAGIVLLVLRRARTGLANYAFVIIPVLVYMGFAAASRINIGVRHILPVYPFVLLIAAAAAKELLARRLAGRIAFASLMIFWIAEFARVYPHTLTFFNTLAGGPQNGLTHLADSNLDWGQDLKLLKSWIEKKELNHINLAYFGTADPGYYGIACTHLPGAPFFAEESVASPTLPGYVAVSATTLSGVYLTPPWRLFYGGFRDLRPAARIGNSIFVYWVERWPEADTPSPAGTHRELADALLFDLKWPDHSVVHYRASLNRQPNDVAILSKLGIALFESGKTGEAAEVLRRAAGLAPEDGETRTRLAAALLKNREIDEGELHARAAVKLSPESPAAHDILGVAFVGRGRFDAAAAAFEKALELSPDFKDAREHLSLLREYLRPAK